MARPIPKRTVPPGATHWFSFRRARAYVVKLSASQPGGGGTEEKTSIYFPNGEIRECYPISDSNVPPISGPE